MTEEYKTVLLQTIADLKEKSLGATHEWAILPKDRLILVLADAVQGLILESKPKE